MVEVTLHLLAKAALTAALVVLILFCAQQLWRLWSERPIGLDVFRYVGARDAGEAAGRHFTELVRLRLEELGDLFARDARRDGATGPIIPSTDQAGRGIELSLPILAGSGPLPFKLDLYGVEVTSLWGSLDRWLQRPYLVSGTVWELGSSSLRVKAELSGGTRLQPVEWEIQGGDAEDASARLACRVAYHFLGQASPALMNGVVADEFCAFDRAWRSYRTWNLYFRGFGQQQAAGAALQAARQETGQLVAGATAFPFAYKLATLIELAAGSRAGAESRLADYRQHLATAGLRDSDLDSVAEQVAALEAPAPTALVAASAEELGLRGRLRPVVPGASISSGHATAGTVCCVVADPRGGRFLLSAEHAVIGERGTAVYQPGLYDGGTEDDRIGVVHRILRPQLGVANNAAGALVALLPDIEALSTAPGIGPIRGVAEAVSLGQKVRALGRTSGLVEGQVTRLLVETKVAGGETEVATFVGMIETTSISAAGDSGAPVVDEVGRLVGFVYAGSAQKTIVMPIRPVLEALGVTLAE
jgi:hypothetical protein